MLVAGEERAAGVDEGGTTGSGGDIDCGVIGCGESSIGGDGSLSDVDGEESSFDLDVDGWSDVGSVDDSHEAGLYIGGNIFAGSERGGDAHGSDCGYTERQKVWRVWWVCRAGSSIPELL